MDTPLSLTEMRSAVGDLTGALIEHRPLTDEQWDRAIATLLTAREQHGGRIRQLIHAIFDVGRSDAPAGQLPGALSELRCHLAVADDPVPPVAPTTSRWRRTVAVTHTQLRLFDPPDESEPAAHAGGDQS